MCLDWASFPHFGCLAGDLFARVLILSPPVLNPSRPDDCGVQVETWLPAREDLRLKFERVAAAPRAARLLFSPLLVLCLQRLLQPPRTGFAAAR